MPETWRTIPSASDYEASSRGRVRLIETRKLVKQREGKGGILFAWLPREGVSRRVKSLVYEAFAEPAYYGVPIHVMNGDERDIRPKNLVQNPQSGEVEPHIPTLEEIVENIWKELCPIQTMMYARMRPL